MKLEKKQILIIVVIIALLLFLLINYIKNKPEVVIDDITDEQIEIMNATTGKIQGVQSITYYDVVRNAIQKLYFTIGELHDPEVINSQEEGTNLDSVKAIVYSMLSKDYINKHDITLENIDSKLPNIPTEVNIEIYNCYYMTRYESSDVYFVKGLYRKDNTAGNEFIATVYVDDVNNTFEIDLDNVLGEDYGNLTEGKEISTVIPERIENRENNLKPKTKVTYGQYAERIFSNTRKLLLYDTDKAYEMLDEKGKEKFPTIDSFKNYITENYKDIYGASFKTYENVFENQVPGIKVYSKNQGLNLECYQETFSEFTFRII